jgi:hypothetical protein
LSDLVKYIAMAVLAVALGVAATKPASACGFGCYGGPAYGYGYYGYRPYYHFYGRYRPYDRYHYWFSRPFYPPGTGG